MTTVLAPPLAAREGVLHLVYPVVAAIGIGCGVTVLLVTVFNYFVAPMSADLELSKVELAGALSLHLASLIVAIPLAGQLTDRFGARAVILVSGAMYAIGLYAISLQQGSRTTLFITFALCGALGAGASPISYAKVLVQRFDRARGLALGVALSGTGLASIVLPRIVTPLIAGGHWRSAFVMLAGLAAGAALLAGLLAGPRRLKAIPADEAGDLRSVLASPAFWSMTVAFACLAAALSAVVAHLSEIWHALDLDPASVPKFQAYVGVATIGGRLLGGAAMDRVPAKFVAACAAIAGAAGILLLSIERDPGWILIAAAIGFGFCNGAESDALSYLSSRYFGIARFARVYGLQGACFMIGFSAGPVAYAIAAQHLPVRGVIAGAAALLVASASVLLRLPRAPGAGNESRA